MRRLRLYLDTSVWYRLSDDTQSPRRLTAIRFLNVCTERHDLFSSALVKHELGRIADLRLRARVREELVSRVRGHLVRDAAADAVGRELQALGGFSGRRVADLTHVGYAVLGGCYAVLTWDLRTLAVSSVRRALRQWERRQGRSVPRILTPEEFLRCPPSWMPSTGPT